MAHDRAVLLRQSRKVQRRARLAVDMGRHAEQRADGDDAGAADTGDEDVERPVQRRRRRQRQVGKQRRRIGSGAIGFAQLAAVHGDKARAESLDAGKILVAVRLVDPPLASEFGLQRLHRNAVGGHRAVATALANALVDEHALLRIGIESALAAATLFGGAGLVVDQYREALDLAQFLLDRIEIAAVMDGRTGGDIVRRILVGFVGDDGELLRPFRRYLMRDLRHRQAAFGRLAAGHRHRIVVENLVGDVDT